MMLALFYDIVATGLPISDLPAHNQAQPHIVQLAAKLVDLRARATEAVLSVSTFPTDWTIPDRVAVRYCIPTERARKVGLHEAEAVRAFIRLWQQADFRVAHGEGNAAELIRIALTRFLCTLTNGWNNGAFACTSMTASIAVASRSLRAADISAPPAAFPSLSAVYQQVSGHGLGPTRSALANVNACMEIYFAYQDRLSGRTPVSRSEVSHDAC